MRWGDFRRSENVEDRTGEAPAGGGFPIGGLHIGGGALIIIVIVGWLFGINPLDMIGMLSGGGGGPTVQQVAPRAGSNPADATRKDFSAAVLGDTEDVWGAVFRQMGRQYVPPTLVLYHGATRSGCGVAQEQVGPFYCPADRKLYLDTDFFDELRRRFGAPGEFAEAYVIAHEVGHHVQNLLGTMSKVQAEMQQGGERRANALSVRLELQADCYAGVWGFYAKKRNLIDTSDIQGGLRAAAAVGDDNIQRATQGYVVPDSFTHGTAAQRTHWFETGLDSGDLRECNTFAAGSP
jgi:uncharacterized protein